MSAVEKPYALEQSRYGVWRDGEIVEVVRIDAETAKTATVCRRDWQGRWQGRSSRTVNPVWVARFATETEAQAAADAAQAAYLAHSPAVDEAKAALGAAEEARAAAWRKACGADQ